MVIVENQPMYPLPKMLEYLKQVIFIIKVKIYQLYLLKYCRVNEIRKYVGDITLLTMTTNLIFIK